MTNVDKKRTARKVAKDGCRSKQGLLERFKYLGILLVVNGVGISSVLNNPLISPSQAINTYAGRNVLVFLLLIVEIIRQTHFLAAENIKTYWGLWVRGTITFHAKFGKLHPFTRHRISKTARLSFIFYVLASLISASISISVASVPAYMVTTFKSLIKGFIEALSQADQMIQFGLLAGIVIFQFVAMFWFLSRGGYETYFPEDIKTRFSDVWGQDHVMSKVSEVITYLEEPEKIEKSGGYVPGGILLWGPPGTGKTLMAEAIAGETGKPFVFVEPGAFQAMFVGVGNMKVKALYKKLRKLSVKYDGVIVFFDEADSLGNRGGGVSSFTENTTLLNSAPSCGSFQYISKSSQEEIISTNNKIITGMPMNGAGGGAGLQALLAEMNGIKKPRGFFNRFVRRALGMKPLNPPRYRILTIMATNMPDSLDPALLRPGRIDRLFRVGYPSKEGRVMTFKKYLDKVPHELTYDQIERIATSTVHATGATIKDMVNEALINSLRDDRELVNWEDMVKAKRFKEFGPAEDVEYVMRERHAVAIHEACHAVAAFILRKRLSIDTATIEKGADYLGLVSSIQTEELFTRWKSDYEADISVAIASLAGERLFFNNDSTSGVSGDLQTATKIAAMMESSWGMGGSYGVSSIMTDAHIGQAKGDTNKPSSERVEKRLEQLYTSTLKLLSKNRIMVLSLAHALETHKTLNGADVEAILRMEKGDLVDGTIYANRKNQLLLESYHKEVLSTHSVGESTHVELPTLENKIQTKSILTRKVK